MRYCLPNFCGNDPTNQGITCTQGKHTSSVAAPPRLPMLIQVEATGLQKMKETDHGFKKTDYRFKKICPYLQVTSSEDVNNIMYKSKIGYNLPTKSKNEVQWLIKIELTDYDRKDMKLNCYVYHNSYRYKSKNFIIGQALDMKLMIDYTQNLTQVSSSGSTRVTGKIAIKDMGYFIKPPLNTPATGLARPTAFVVDFEAHIMIGFCESFSTFLSFHPVLKISGPWNVSSGEWQKEKMKGKGHNVLQDLAITEAVVYTYENLPAIIKWDMFKINLPGDYDGSFQSEFRRAKLLLEVFNHKPKTNTFSLLGSADASIEDLLFRKEYTKKFKLWMNLEYEIDFKGALFLNDFGLFAEEEAAGKKEVEDG